MTFFWRGDRLHVDASNAQERALLMAITQHDGLRRTDPLTSCDFEGKALEVVISGPEHYDSKCPHCIKSARHAHYFANVPAIVGADCAGVSASDAYNGVMILAFRMLADLLEMGKDIPPQAEALFKERA